jgi:hypothetical protein
LQIKTKIVGSLTADSKPVKLEVNGTVILPPLVFPAEMFEFNFERVSPCLAGTEEFSLFVGGFVSRF